MKILLLAPHPFFEERGTPIDVSLILRVLSERPDTNVDLVVYHQGDEFALPNLRIFRTPDFKFLNDIRPGFSLKKLICDLFMFLKSWKLLITNKYDIIHAGEEAVFFAMFFKLLYGIPYLYDLDSSIAQQLIEKSPYLKFFAPLFNRLEKMAVRGAKANLPVCNALAELCEKNGSKKTVTIHDISQLKNPGAGKKGLLKAELGIDSEVVMYIGNLETYQGIDLLIESFKMVCSSTDRGDLVIIGGKEKDIAFYKRKVKELGIENRVYFLGPRPFDMLDDYLAEADIITCPRIKGINTPMKIFPYLHSGKPVVATNLYTHSQILTHEEAYLASPDPAGFAGAILDLLLNPDLRLKFGEKARAFIERNHTYSAHQERVNKVYDWVENSLTSKPTKIKEQGSFAIIVLLISYIIEGF